ncbi:hypothetical protein Gasu2_33940 [Galdieria sulphuraria]|nr:hypothetical protein Gasu2_33940 [Galdieria sulphuraria]
MDHFTNKNPISKPILQLNKTDFGGAFPLSPAVFDEDVDLPRITLYLRLWNGGFGEFDESDIVRITYDLNRKMTVEMERITKGQDPRAFHNAKGEQCLLFNNGGTMAMYLPQKKELSFFPKGQEWEKNWAPIEGSDLFFLSSHTTTLRLQPLFLQGPPLSVEIGKVRGGTPFVQTSKDVWMAFGHSAERNEKQMTYQAVPIQFKGSPFNPLQQGTPLEARWFFEYQSLRNGELPYNWKSIVFPTAFFRHRDKYFIGAHLDDKESILAAIDLYKLNYCQE